jgi:hypothetical protein
MLGRLQDEVHIVTSDDYRTSGSSRCWRPRGLAPLVPFGGKTPEDALSLGGRSSMLVARPSSVYILVVDAALLLGRHTNSYDRARREVDL